LRHWDVRQAVDKPAQTYDYHQSSNVNACSFCDMGRRFVSTGDDKKILVWDLAVPAPIKIFSETWLPGMPALATHPGSFTVAALGMDSKIANFRVSKKSGKILRSGDVTAEGFKAAGFACEPCFSPDGEFLACGDGDEGGVWIWRLKRKRGDQGGLVQRLAGAHAPGTPVSSVMWHPAFEGVLLSVGWDGRLKWWGM
jgi:WD40 repeat protein